MSKHLLQTEQAQTNLHLNGSRLFVKALFNVVEKNCFDVSIATGLHFLKGSNRIASDESTNAAAQHKLKASIANQHNVHIAALDADVHAVPKCIDLLPTLSLTDVTCS